MSSGPEGRERQREQWNQLYFRSQSCGCILCTKFPLSPDAVLVLVLSQRAVCPSCLPCVPWSSFKKTTIMHLVLLSPARTPARLAVAVAVRACSSGRAAEQILFFCALPPPLPPPLRSSCCLTSLLSRRGAPLIVCLRGGDRPRPRRWQWRR